eukprot:3326707-Rhodomonas_salina.1
MGLGLGLGLGLCRYASAYASTEPAYHATRHPHVIEYKASGAYAICLRARYAISGTELAHAAMTLCSSQYCGHSVCCCYRATRPLCNVRYWY